MALLRRTPSILAAMSLAVVQLGGAPARAQSAPAWLATYTRPAERLIAEATGDTFAWRRLAFLTDTFGNRLSGSPALERAIAWAATEMRADGLENVHTEPVMVPHWVRGAERADIIEPSRQPLVMLGLGNSVGTPAEGVQAEVAVVRSFGELDDRNTELRGRIVLLNVPYTTYNETVGIRMAGASRAARYGAVALLIRSVGPPGLRLAHTGLVQYAADAPRIPAAALATEDADRLQRLANRGERIEVRLQMDAHMEADALSANVVGEIRGRELPEQIVVVGGHLDSWDVGDGASDDGGGCVVTWEALRLMKKLGLRPRRTVRVVLWTNEENGTRGALAYRDQHRAELPNHVLLIESDSGVFRPRGFGFTGADGAGQTIRSIASLLSPIGAEQVTAGGGGADIDPAGRAGKIPELSLAVDETAYFLVHHTAADTVDKIDPSDMARCAAAVAVMAYVAADLPFTLR